MTPQQIHAVKSSFAAVRPISDQAGLMFYAKLFELDPALRTMFKSDITEQSGMLMQMIGVAVAGLDRLDTIILAVQALGRRHRGYGVTDAHYDTVAQALLWTLQQGLGDSFTPEVREAWTVTYVLLANTMKTASCPTL